MHAYIYTCIGKHDAPIRCINSIADMNMVATIMGQISEIMGCTAA